MMTRRARVGSRSQPWAFLCLVFALSACSRGMSAAEVVSQLKERGFTVERLEKTLVSQRDLDRLPEPREMFSIQISDEQGNRDRMTLLCFKNESQAAEADRARVNGFAAGNCFFAGIIPNHFKDPIKEALR